MKNDQTKNMAATKLVAAMPLLFGLDSRDVNRPELAAVFGIFFRIKRDLLALVQGFVSVGYNRRKMHKNILAAIIV
jgi:hypothetical protein